MTTVHMNDNEKMMIFERKLQNSTKHSRSYGAKSFVCLQPKRAFLNHEYVLEAFLC